jgi:hypothetical protein
MHYESFDGCQPSLTATVAKQCEFYEAKNGYCFFKNHITIYGISDALNYSYNFNVMVKAVRGILYKGFSDPMPNLDSEKTLLFGSYDLIICRKCLKLYGRLVRILPDLATGRKRSGWRYQKCQCMIDEDKKNGKSVPRWLGNDFNISVEFCHCCSKKLINSGSRFSSFYCSECLKLIKENNDQSENLQIPLGRHSFMNNINLKVPYSKEEEAQFTIRLNNFFEKVGLIREWQKYCLFENLHDLGFNFQSDISLSYYDSLIKKQEDDSLIQFKRMIKFLCDHG